MKKPLPVADFMPAILRNWIAGFLLVDYRRRKSALYTIVTAISVISFFSQTIIRPAFAQNAMSANFAVEAATLANGGGAAISSGRFVTVSVIGQGLAPLSRPASATFTLELGQPDILSAIGRSRDEEMRWKISEITALTEVLGPFIPPAVWQRDDDPYIYWGVLVEPSSLITGFSISLDGMPDSEPETSADFYQFADDSIPSGQHLIYVRPLLAEGVLQGDESVRTFELWVDTALPIINQLNPAAGSMINDNKITLSCHAADPESGIDTSTLKMSLNGVTQAVVYDSETQTLHSSSEVFMADGTNTVIVTVYDLAGNHVSQAWQFIADAQPPTGSLQVNGGAEVTYSAYVSLHLQAVDTVSGVSRVFISNDGIFDTELSGGYGYEPVITGWLVADPDVDGVKRVYVKFQDKAGNISATYSDEITMRRMTPDTRIISGPEAVTDETDARFTFEATRPGSLFSVSLDGSAWTAWAASQQASYTGLSKGNHYFFVKSGFDLNGDGRITVDEEDSTPAQRVWTIGEEGMEELIDQKTLYWKR